MYFKNGSAAIVASGTPINKITPISVCQTTASCSGGSDEVRTTLSYGPQTAGMPNNLLMVSASSGSGDGALTATTALRYDMIGNVLTVDGPLPGTADTTRLRYDADRELVAKSWRRMPSGNAMRKGRR